MATQHARLHFQAEIEHFRAGLVEMASLVLSQVERAVAAWEDVDASATTRSTSAAPSSTRRSSASSS